MCLRLPAELRRERIEKETSVLGLRDALGALISTYSHGMKQKLAIAAALLHNPKLLILDEPFVGLDPEAVAQLKQTMRRLCEAGSSCLFLNPMCWIQPKRSATKSPFCAAGSWWPQAKQSC